MASRRLALNLRHAVRTRSALNSIRSPLTRGLATPVSHGANTESTTLSNGFTVYDVPRDEAEHILTQMVDC